jgi:hypothetical protein
MYALQDSNPRTIGDASHGRAGAISVRGLTKRFGKIDAR